MMRVFTKISLACLLLLLTWPQQLTAMPPKALVALKQAGIGDQVIQAVAREKVLETAAFTVEELIQLKNAGMSDETLEILVVARSFIRQRQPIVYGRSFKPLHLSSVEDLVALKQSGMSDEIIQAIVVAASPRRDEAYERAWNMLDRMGIEIEVRP